MTENFEIMLYPTQCDHFENLNVQIEHLDSSEAEISDLFLIGSLRYSKSQTPERTRIYKYKGEYNNLKS